MCTLITLFRAHPAAPLVVALNRDEFVERATAPLQRWRPDGATSQVVSGRDLRSGGTWFGIGPVVCAGLTNDRSQGRSPPGSRSRGELVLRALLAPDLTAVRAELGRLRAEEYGPFHLLASDGTAMLWLESRRGPLQCHEVPPGLHVLGNHGLDDTADPVVARVRRALGDAAAATADELEQRLKALLALHDEGGPCVHLGSFQTRSATLLFRGGPNQRLWATDGPPCQSAWSDHSHLL